MTTSLPTNYVAAKQALATCTRIDECKSWADKAKALASYGKQMKDRSLEDMAQRIRDRAVRRGGELLVEVKKGKTGPKLKGGAPPQSRKEAAKKAGLSPDQAKQMVRVANVPSEKFERMVEAKKPATVEELADAGTKKKGERVKPEPYRNEWTDWWIAVKHLAAIPACGLEVLAKRRPDVLADLLAQCEAALTNLRLWKSELEKVDVNTAEEIEAA